METVFTSRVGRATGTAIFYPDTLLREVVREPVRLRARLVAVHAERALPEESGRRVVLPDQVVERLGQVRANSDHLIGLAGRRVAWNSPHLPVLREHRGLGLGLAPVSGVRVRVDEVAIGRRSPKDDSIGISR